jgi:hypothetical protein
MHQTTKSEQIKLQTRVTEAESKLDVSPDPTAAIDSCNIIVTTTSTSTDPALEPDDTVEP